MKILRIIQKFGIRYPRKLYIKNPENIEFKTLKQFLNFAISENGFFKETFSNKECTIKQCHSARRSIPDLLALVNTYIPNVSERKLILNLLTLKDPKKYAPVQLEFRYCTDINKRVVRLGWKMWGGANAYWMPDMISSLSWTPILQKYNINLENIGELQKRIHG